MREGSHHPPLLRTPNVVEEPPETPIPAVIVTGSDHSVRNIWADHRARRAMFPTRQRTMQPDDDDEDIYQMFVPTEPGAADPNVPSERTEASSSPKTARPCSWHTEQVPTVQVHPPPSGGRVLRRASSVGEKTTEARQSPDDDLSGNLDVIHTESSSNDLSGSSSAEQLTIDDIENVYDNISYEDLKTMGLVRRDPEENQTRKEAFTAPLDPLEQAGRVENASKGAEVRNLSIEPESFSESNSSSTQEGRALGTCNLKIVEENIYDTICFREPPAELKRLTEDDKLEKERDSLLASEQDLTESLRGFLSEESLHFVDDEGPDSSHRVLCSSEPDYSSSSASETFSQHSHKKDKMSERVDEIWNDLENYIKNNEKKADRLPAAFPVNVTESPKKSTSNKNSPTKSSIATASPSPPSKPPPVTSTPSFTIPIIKLPDLHDEDLNSEDSHSPVPAPQHPPVTPEPPPGTVKNIRNRLARLSSGSFRLEDDDLVEVPQKSTQQKESLKDLSSFFPGELAGLDSPLASPSLLLGESVDFSLELMDKSKSRVFLMARQYSQKIKKANQLLRMRSMDPGDSCSRARAEKRQKDLTAILEEKKQGGAAIGNEDCSDLCLPLFCLHLKTLTLMFSFVTGARIAEYSQLYDQVMFKSPGAGQAFATRHQSHPGLPSSPSMPETSLEEDWLHSTYSNGELASFVPSTNETDEARGSSAQQRLTSSFSIPSLQTIPPAPSSLPSQRWSMTPPGEKEEHAYSSIKRNPSFNSPALPSSKSLPAGDCQSVSQAGPRSHGPADTRHHSPSLCHAGRQSSLPERPTQGQSDLTLHDGQQVVVLNRSSGLSVVSATQNYLANFKDNDEDDDDYVEIRSEDESEKEPDVLAQRVGTSTDLHHQAQGLTQSRSLPCTPVRSCNPLGSLDREELEKYMWSEPQHNQPTIVQSLREKFQCLSSSSFA